jgi:hypothetical protein
VEKLMEYHHFDFKSIDIQKQNDIDTILKQYGQSINVFQNCFICCIISGNNSEDEKSLQGIISYFKSFKTAKDTYNK